MSLDLEAGTLEFTVLGTPAPQGSKRPFTNRRTGKAQLVESSSKDLRPWREAVAWAAMEAGNGAVFDGPLELTIEFRLKRPAIAKHKVFSAKRPDLDKLIRAVSDALTDSGVIADDARVAVIHATKRYALSNNAWTGAVIRIATLEDD